MYILNSSSFSIFVTRPSLLIWYTGIPLSNGWSKTYYSVKVAIWLYWLIKIQTVIYYFLLRHGFLDENKFCPRQDKIPALMLPQLGRLTTFYSQYKHEYFQIRQEDQGLRADLGFGLYIPYFWTLLPLLAVPTPNITCKYIISYLKRIINTKIPYSTPPNLVMTNTERLTFGTGGIMFGTGNVMLQTFDWLNTIMRFLLDWGTSYCSKYVKTTHHFQATETCRMGDSVVKWQIWLKMMSIVKIWRQPYHSINYS